MSLDLSRWQFATTSIYHFLFVPVTIGLAFLVALLQTPWYRNGDDTYRRLTRFFGTLLLINVAVGVVTGLIQEFEFGMNWSAYSRLVGNVFGGPLAMEGLVAFFLESTFLGIWIFGWNRLSKKAHLACIWLVAAGTMLSAAFIMAANSWMQHPVGYTTNNSTHQPQLNNIWALFTNPVFLWGYTHVVVASLVTGALVMLAVSAWHLYAEEPGRGLPPHGRHLAGGPVAGGRLQPLRRQRARRGRGQVPADEDRGRRGAVDHLRSHCSFSLFQIGGGNNDETPDADPRDPRPALHPRHQPRRRRGAGAQQPQRRSTRRSTGRGTTSPTSSSSTGPCGSWPTWARWSSSSRCGGPGCSTGTELERAKWFLRIAPWVVILPFLMNTAGWMLTENGRQPWIVQGLMKTANGVSPSVIGDRHLDLA